MNITVLAAAAMIAGPVSGDNAPQTNAAISAAQAAGGGVVAVAAGRYELDSQIAVAPHVHLVCADNGFDAGTHGIPTVEGQGTIFEVRWGSGSGSADSRYNAAVTLGKSSIENCGFDYPDQNSAAGAPIEYGPTILAVDGGSEAIHNFCTNCYSFLDFRGSVTGVGLYNLTVERNWGAPLLYGLRINGVGDWGHYGGNIFHVGWFDFDDWATDHLSWWSATNGTAFEVGNADWANLDDEQEVGYLFGLRLAFNDTGFFGEHRGPVYLSRAQFDGCFYACVAAVGGGTIMDLRVDGGTFTAYDLPQQSQTSASGGIALYVDGATTVNQLQYLNNYVFGPTNYVVYSSGVRDLVIANNTGSVAGSPTASGGAAFTFWGAQNVVLSNNIFHGFSRVYDGSVAGLFSQSSNTAQ